MSRYAHSVSWENSISPTGSPYPQGRSPPWPAADPPISGPRGPGLLVHTGESSWLQAVPPAAWSKQPGEG